MEIPKILIVEDEKETRDNLNNFLLPRINCEILEAENAYQAIEKIESTRVDLILLDINMPGISGIEVIKKVNEISKDTAIIVLTKLESSNLAEQIEQMGAMYIPKPFSMKIVYEEVKKKLESVNKLSLKEGN